MKILRATLWFILFDVITGCVAFNAILMFAVIAAAATVPTAMLDLLSVGAAAFIIIDIFLYVIAAVWVWGEIQSCVK
jgi:hypothetical protein